MDERARGGKTELLGNRNFMLLWCAYGVSAMGDHLSEMAILKTQNAASAAVDVTPLDARMTFLFFVPFLLFAPLTGWLADRLPRRGLMIVSDAARCLILFSFALLMSWTAPLGSWGPFLPLVLVGAFAALFSPARAALLPMLIRPDQLVRANGMISGLGIIATMFAIKIGGYLAEHYDPEFAFRLDAGTFVMSAGLLLLLRAPRQKGESKGYAGFRDSLGEIGGGFRYALCHRRVRELIGVAVLVWFCGPLVKCVIPAVARDVYGGSYSEISNYRMYLGVGFVIGAILVTLLGRALRSEIAITWGLLGIGVSILVFALSTFLPFGPRVLAGIGAFGVAGAGVFGVAVMSGLNALLQRIVPSRYLGRVYGVKDVCCTAALLTATGALGIPGWTEVDRWVGYILLGVAFMTFAAGVFTLAVRLRRSPFPAAYGFASSANEFVARFWWRFQRDGASTVPREGAVIVTANHTCAADPLFLSAGVRYRLLSFMVAAEYTTWPVFRYFMRVAESIPVRRGTNDPGATKQAIRQLRGGKSLGIFIEGRIVRRGEVSEPKDGVAMLALRTGAEVVPAYISGVVRGSGIIRGLLVRHRACVRFGPPVDLDEFRGEKPSRDAVRAATLKIFEAIQALAPSSSDAGSHVIADDTLPSEYTHEPP